MRVMRGADFAGSVFIMTDVAILSSSDMFADLLMLVRTDNHRSEQPADTVASAPRILPEEAEETEVDLHHYVAHKPGRVLLHMQFPDIITVVTDFVQSHGFYAQSRRRSQVGRSMDVSLEDIQAHLMDKIPKLRAAWHLSNSHSPTFH